MPKKLFLYAVFMMCGLTSLTAKADIIPKDLLELDKQRCLKDCVPGFGETTCKPLCDCTVAEFSKRLDFSQYLDLSVELSKNDLKPENRKLLDTIANYCTAEIEKAGIVVGQPAQ
ncbi:hypothetical protein [Kordiimonas pumila]|uniref:Uncharacterized protein n=1 Tax=Kordiimonas pumila TaxID=2161677 RepID=A0ABV7D8L3_9PROT|nr:hypothetical protein [Kordiimonas pumila]